MQINNLINDIEDIYYDKDFLILIESYLTHLRNSTKVTFVNVNDAKNYKYVGDFYGLLNEFRIDKKYHYIVLRINKLNNSGDYKGNLDIIILPDFTEIEQMKNVLLTKN